MKRPTRRQVGLAATAAIIGTLGVIGIAIQPRAAEVCVTVYEDANQQGDHRAFCAIGATNVHISNLGSYSTPLVNGCNRGVNQSSTYNDCISSADVAVLPANTKVQFYRDISYGSTLLKCYDVDGIHNIDLSGTNDTISSFRIVSGNC